MRDRQIRGFTLIEVMIAFAILGLSLSSLYGVFAGSLSRMRRDAQLAEGTLLAQSLLSRAGLEFPALQESYQGEWEGYNYQLTQHWMDTSDNSARTPQLLRVTARVRRGSGSGPVDIELATIKLVPRPGSQ